MNQTIRNSGGKCAAPSRSARVFRRSLTPTLALLAAMTLGLVGPPAAEAQLYNDLELYGGGGGGGGGGANKDAGGAGGAGGGGAPTNGTVGSTTQAGTGGNGSSGSYMDMTGSGITNVSNGGPPTAGDPSDSVTKTGGYGGSVTHTATANTIYRNLEIVGGLGGASGSAGIGDWVANPGAGGYGGNARFNANSNITTTITGDLIVRSGGLRANSGNAYINHLGTVKITDASTSPVHNLYFTNKDTYTTAGGTISVYINNLQISGSKALVNTSQLIYDNRIVFNTISLINDGTNAAKLDFAANTQWSEATQGYLFNNLYVSGTGNQINLGTTNGKAYTPGKVDGKLYFVARNNVTTTSTPMVIFGDVSTGNGLNLAGFNPGNLVIVGEQSYYQNLREGQTITLARGVNDSTGVFRNNPYRTTVYKGGLRFEDFYLRTTAATNADLTATFGGKAKSVRTGEAFTPYFQGQMAALYTVSGGSRPVLERATKALSDTPTSVGEPLISLYATGSDITLNTGSSVDVESFGGVLAVGTKFNNSAGLTTVAAFGEFGTGSYDTYKHIPDLTAFNSGRFVGSGDTDYAGGGVFFHHLFDPSHFAGGFSLEGSFRVGNVKNEFNLDMLDRSGYDISRRYWGGHLGLGYNYLLTNMDSVDFFGQIHMAHVEEGTFQTSAGERLHFLAAKSTVSRLGGRYNHNFNELLRGYATAAWEYEFEGDVGGSVDRTRIQKAPNVEGSSGFGQLGLNVKSANNPVSLDLSVFGVTGQQEGYGGTIGLKLDF